MNPILIIGSGLALVVVLVALFWSDDSNAKMKRRLARVSGEAVPEKETKTPTQNLRRRTTDSEIPLVDRIIKAVVPNPDKLRARLGRTGRSYTVSEYLLASAVMIAVFYLVFVSMAGWSKPASFFAGIAVGLYVPHSLVGRMGERRIRAFLGSFPEAIDTICRGLRSGLPITESINAVGREMPDPVGIEFRRIGDAVRMGRSLDESLWEVAQRLDTPEYRFFIIALAIQRETGGNLAETLGNLAELLRRRRQLKLKIRAMSSEAKASAMIIGSLPFLMFTLLFFVNHEYVMTLLTDPRGKMMLGVGLSWLGMGVLAMKKMISFEI